MTIRELINELLDAMELAGGEVKVNSTILNETLDVYENVPITGVDFEKDGVWITSNISGKTRAP